MLVRCWAHCRRYFFEAALCRHPAGVQGLMRIRAIYAADAAGRRLPRAERGPFRATHLRPLMDEFFAWAAAARDLTPAAPRDQGARLRAQPAGRAAPRPRRRRPPWTTRAPSARCARSSSAAELALLRHRHPRRGRRRVFSLAATCRLRARPVRLPRRGPARPAVLARRERYLELAPQRWRATRARLDPADLEAPDRPHRRPALAEAAAASALPPPAPGA
ncbi:MAG: transposase [Kofleriaceae bacterium]|nr:transposase [Kofleriaceae bacterium]